MKWALEKRHVPEEFKMSSSRRVALEAAAALGQQHEGKVRPFGLALDPVRKFIQVGARQRFLSYEREPGTGLEPLDEIRNIPNDRALQRSFFEHGAGDGCIATLRGEDERLFR
jgi:hypothetical protein